MAKRFKEIPRWLGSAWKPVRDPVFLLFLVISFTLWYINKLNHVYTTDVGVTLEVRGDFRNGMRLSRPVKVDCRVRGLGYNLLVYKLFDVRRPVVVEASSLTLERQDSIYYLSPVSVEAALFNRLDGVELVSLLNHEFKVDLIRSTDRKVPVVANITVDLKGEYMQIGDVSLEPDSVVVSGSAALLDTIRYVYTRPLVIRDLRRREGSLKLVPMKGVRFSVGSVRFRMDIVEFTEIERRARVEVRHKAGGKNTRYAVIPETVTLSINVPNRYYREARDMKIVPYVDLKADNAVLGQVIRGQRYAVRLDSLPRWIKVKAIRPAYITVLKEVGND